jgi:manganese oxidase
MNAAFVPLFNNIPEHPRLVDPKKVSGFPKVKPNDNRVTAGTLKGNLLEVELEVKWADFHPEGYDRTGLRVIAIGEKGKSPSIPAPLLRVRTGTKIKVRVHNTLSDSTITFYGLQSHPAKQEENFLIQPGQTREIEFDPGAPGTYLYRAIAGRGLDPTYGDEDQLAGAFVIDPKAGSPPDRVFVINGFATLIDAKVSFRQWYEALTINGLAYPKTEAMRLPVNDTVRWRIVNASIFNHPMHLHGFYYRVKSIGTALEDSYFSKELIPMVVTQNVRPRTTFMMEWVPTRPGKWMFHCHVPWHVGPHLRLPGNAELDAKGHEQHMAGLVIPLEVLPGSTDIVSKGTPKNITLYANEFSATQSRFSLTANSKLEPSPALILKQFQTTYVTVKNNKSGPTGVHWHGLEIDAWSDGIPDFSASDGKMSPKIKPGSEFTYKLSAIRPGTFIYHSHLDDEEQIASGLYGPMIVIPEHETYDSSKDHIYVIGSNSPDDTSIDYFELNGGSAQPDQHASTNEVHRLRLINIAVEDRFVLALTKNGTPVPIMMIAKDGADLPALQQRLMDQSPVFEIGETGDFIFKPTEPGEYVLQVTSKSLGKGWSQRWVIK